MKMMMDNRYSTVWYEPVDGGWVYKRQHEFMTDNEYWCLKQMAPSGYVPEVEQVDRDLIRTRYIHPRDLPPPLSLSYLMIHERLILQALQDAGIRHGDLTEYAVLLGQDDRLYIIDFAESRLWDDPRPDKRPEGDAFWLRHSLKAIGMAYNAQ